MMDQKASLGVSSSKAMTQLAFFDGLGRQLVADKGKPSSVQKG